jgi:hypothetical protein
MQIREAISNATSDYDKEKLHERLAKLSGGVAVLKVHSSYQPLQRFSQLCKQMCFETWNLVLNFFWGLYMVLLIADWWSK